MCSNQEIVGLMISVGSFAISKSCSMIRCFDDIAIRWLIAVLQRTGEHRTGASISAVFV
jgi:hypothetical protein